MSRQPETPSTAAGRVLLAEEAPICDEWTEADWLATIVAIEQEARAAAAREVAALRGVLGEIIAAYEDTSLEHDVTYEDFADCIRSVRYRLWMEERDTRASRRAKQ